MADTSKRAAKLAREITAFAGRHGGSAEGQIAYVGQTGARIVLVGADGGWGDLMAPSVETARQATEQAGITVHDTFDGELAGKVSTGPYEWSRMAGIQLGGPAGA
ncbi:MAG: hypothetical protein ACRDP3_03785 [Streptomyces sp.]|uniref:hypothetical protein n=1 Tax=Streptomyces sp. TaxID=1931 RepID=UPI003D6A44D2